MEKVIFMVWFFYFASISAIQVQSTYYYRSELYKPVQEKKTQLHFFVHDTLSGRNPTSVKIAGPNTTTIDKNDPAPFGTTFTIDDLITEGPDITSKVIGNSRGIYVSASQDKNLTLVMYVDLGFITDKFKGSSLSVFSRNPVTESPRELAVVGGRGLFRFARGFILVKSHFLNATTGDAILEYNVEVIHP